MPAQEKRELHADVLTVRQFVRKVNHALCSVRRFLSLECVMKIVVPQGSVHLQFAWQAAEIPTNC